MKSQFVPLRNVIRRLLLLLSCIVSQFVPLRNVIRRFKNQWIPVEKMSQFVPLRNVIRQNERTEGYINGLSQFVPLRNVIRLNCSVSKIYFCPNSYRCGTSFDEVRMFSSFKESVPIRTAAERHSTGERFMKSFSLSQFVPLRNVIRLHSTEQRGFLSLQVIVSAVFTIILST